MLGLCLLCEVIACFRQPTIGRDRKQETSWTRFLGPLCFGVRRRCRPAAPMRSTALPLTLGCRYRAGLSRQPVEIRRSAWMNASGVPRSWLWPNQGLSSVCLSWHCRGRVLGHRWTKLRRPSLPERGDGRPASLPRNSGIPGTQGTDEMRPTKLGNERRRNADTDVPALGTSLEILVVRHPVSSLAVARA